jgi:hypothetical protein
MGSGIGLITLSPTWLALVHPIASMPAIKQSTTNAARLSRSLLTLLLLSKKQALTWQNRQVGLGRFAPPLDFPSFAAEKKILPSRQPDYSAAAAAALA